MERVNLRGIILSQGMMSRVSIAEVLEACASTYRTIDIRVAAIRGQDRWHNAFAAIRLTSLSPAEVRAYHARLGKQHGTIATDQFAIALNVRPFSDWEQVYDDATISVIRVGNLRVDVGSMLALGAQVEYLRPPQPRGRLFDDLQWPSLDITAGENPVGKLRADQLVRTVEACGYVSAYQAIAAICEADTWPNTSHGYNFLLRLPIFAALSEAAITPREAVLRTELRRHKALKNVTVQAVFRARSSQIPRGRAGLARLTRFATDGPFETLAGTTTVPNMAPEDIVELSLAHPTLGELERHTYEVRTLLPAVERNLLLEALKHFCPLATLEDLLTNPGVQHGGKTDQSAAFEQHVAWLLSLFGLSPIVLGRHEHLRAGRGQEGSIDILAKRPGTNTLLLVACTIAPPKHEDFAKLWHLTTILDQALSAEATVKIMPVLVTGTTGTELSKPIDDGTNEIPILDINRLRALVNLMPTGNAEHLFEFLANSQHSPLS